MTVQDLINLLNDISDKSLPVFLYKNEVIFPPHKTDYLIELTEEMIDLTITDRIDINIPSDF